ncbi:hypothetical protein BTO05_13060 [Winogradskyella sp. PC-19]|uniref:hypothetical protein n=1 Tax=unclassified Winogradskyella TaxID=2615021 RepID=UPI000B3BF686|nr:MULTISPECIES: hypothetical protein [unclassified Winogradskyella]ARV10515.1 hypothetical protein BTO05_13060 [Winogradskyella sp. PC-19]RZN80656.1 MAG: hypothetical protein EVB12_04065 [Winogradskyella sp.]
MSYPQRRIFFYKVNELLPVDLFEQPIEQIFEDHEIDTLYAARYNKIPFSIVPKKSGKFYINGSVEDIVFMKTKDTSKVRMLSSMISISAEIDVKDVNLNK